MTPDEKRDILIAVFAVTLFILLLCGFIILFVTMYQKKRNRHIVEIMELKQTFDKELLQTQLEIQEQTFRIISQEIHDNIGQVLTLVKLNMAVVPPGFSELPMIVTSRELLSKAIIDLRNLSKTLSPERIAEINLSESIEHELQLLEKTNVYKTTLVATGKFYSLDKDKKIILFRIFQEVLNNIIKHAEATLINVRLEYSETQFGLITQDNGKGFDTALQADGIGLRNIRNRSRLIGAVPHITSQPGRGTEIAIYIPL